MSSPRVPDPQTLSYQQLLDLAGPSASQVDPRAECSGVPEKPGSEFMRADESSAHGSVGYAQPGVSPRDISDEKPILISLKPSVRKRSHEGRQYASSPKNKRRRVATRSMAKRKRPMGRFFVPKLDTAENAALEEKFPHLFSGLDRAHHLFSENGVRYEIVYGMQKYEKVGRLIDIINTEIPNIPRDAVEKLVTQNRKTTVLCATDESSSTVIGGLIYKTHETVYPFAELLLLAVDRRYQRVCGIGTTLVNTMKELLPQSIYTIFVDSDYRAIIFYQKNGFGEDLTIPAKFTEAGPKQLIWDTTLSVRTECRRIRGVFPTRESVDESRRVAGLLMRELARHGEEQMRRSSKT